MKHSFLQKAAAAALFVLLTAALLAAADFLLVDDVHSYSRVMLQELYQDAGNIDTLFLGSSHCYRSVDPAAVDAALGTHSFNAGSSQQLPDGSYYMLKEAAAQNPLKTVYLEMFYTGYNESASANIPLACYLLADHMDWRSPNRYAYLSEMGGLAAYADLLLHVVDVSDEDWQVQAETVDKVIAQLGAQDIPRLMVYNKADKCDPDVIPFFRPDEGVKISAKTGEGVDALLAAIEKALGKGKHRVRLCIPYSDGAVLDMLHREAQIESTDYAAEGTVVEAVVDDKTCGRVSAYIIDNE